MRRVRLDLQAHQMKTVAQTDGTHIKRTLGCTLYTCTESLVHSKVTAIRMRQNHESKQLTARTCSGWECGVASYDHSRDLDSCQMKRLYLFFRKTPKTLTARSIIGRTK